MSFGCSKAVVLAQTPWRARERRRAGLQDATPGRERLKPPVGAPDYKLVPSARGRPRPAFPPPASQASLTPRISRSPESPTRLRLPPSTLHPPPSPSHIVSLAQNGSSFCFQGQGADPTHPSRRGSRPRRPGSTSSPSSGARRETDVIFRPLPPCSLPRSPSLCLPHLCHAVGGMSGVI